MRVVFTHIDKGIEMITHSDPSRELVLGQVLARWARKTPEKEAFVCQEKRYTYSRFNERVNQLAHGLMGLGIGKGDKVAVLFMNCMEFVESYFALAKIGAVTVALNFRLTGRELVYQIDNSDSRALILGQDFLDVVKDVRAQLPGVEHFISVSDHGVEGMVDYEAMLREGSPEEPVVFVGDEDPVMIMYTSGTTGRPKGAMLTHKNQIVDAINFLIETDLGSDERGVCVAPLFHIGALALCLKLLLVGGTTIIEREFVPQAVLRLLHREKITIQFLVPAMWIFLLEQPDIADYDLKTLRMAITGGAAMPIEVKDRLMKQFPNAGVYDVFGQTEMSPCTTLLKARDALRKPGSVGQRMVNVEARIVDDDDRDVPQGEIGEIVYRGPTVMKEYYKNPEATAEAMSGGWFHSGDLVREDQEGYLYVVDRKKDMIISGGENIYAAEVEEVLYSHPGILEAAVIGIPDPQWGENVKAVVVSREGETLNEQEIIDYCRQNLASYKKPKSVEIVDALPRNPSGKVLKYKLREQYGG